MGSHADLVGSKYLYFAPNNSVFGEFVYSVLNGARADSHGARCAVSTFQCRGMSFW